ncbi:TSC22 domain family protein 1-like [Pygocentrus nattereri]|uniref:Uncharacterized protein n=1 Tax=Pygocentrus nattereri TaxID=42514 RepID=A0AAR2IP73_PYGNA|nr:TSC22 domain family protein 1-like [Pygocentrus nattereri]
MNRFLRKTENGRGGSCAVCSAAVLRGALSPRCINAARSAAPLRLGGASGPVCGLKMRCSLTCGPTELHSPGADSPPCSSVCGSSAVAIDNKIEQAMDLVKGHLMLAVREEVEVLKERIKELWERNSELRRENTLLKSLTNLQQLQTLSAQLSPPQSAPEGPQLAEWAQRAQIAEWARRVQWVQQVRIAEWTQLAGPTSPNSNSAALIHHSVTSV